MASELYPLPLSTLRARLHRELDAGGPVFGLPPSAIWRPDPRHDLATEHFGLPMATPLGPASGPHTQLAQNILLCWLGGARFVELKTVQVLDELRIPRPCIHVPHVGWNVEWSQELRVEESALEYSKAWILVHEAARRLGLAPDVVFDMSLGYDLPGISGEKIAGFVRAMREGTLLGELGAGPELPRRISRSVTLSTFHGCPADQIEAIAVFCMRVHGLDTIVKLNPTLHGHAGVAELLHERMGYRHVRLDPHAFEKDLRWEQLEAMVPRLQAVAAECGVGFGVKFSNTLVCQSEEPPFGGGEMYLSGPPLHVLAIRLAARFRAAFPGVPVSFSAGIDQGNFADVVATGIAPVTTCSDLLKGKGYAKLCAYLRELEGRMGERLADFVHGDAAAYAARATEDPRYHHAQNRTAPKKVGSPLVLLDCLTCDKCIPVCPNAAIFAFDLPTGALPGGVLSWEDGAWRVEEGPPTVVRRRHQIGITADLCNQCGQCDPFCPEDGGPFATKPNLFLDPRAWAEHPGRDGFRFDGEALLWRRGGSVLRWGERLETEAGSVDFSGDQVVACAGHGAVALADLHLLRHLRQRLVTGWHPGA